MSSYQAANEGRKLQSFFIRFCNDHDNKPIFLLVLRITLPHFFFLLIIGLEWHMLSEDEEDERDLKITLFNYTDT